MHHFFAKNYRLITVAKKWSMMQILLKKIELWNPQFLSQDVAHNARDSLNLPSFWQCWNFLGNHFQAILYVHNKTNITTTDSETGTERKFGYFDIWGDLKQVAITHFCLGVHILIFWFNDYWESSNFSVFWENFKN